MNRMLRNRDPFWLTMAFASAAFAAYALTGPWWSWLLGIVAGLCAREYWHMADMR